ncbi:hypothetical protein J7L48_08290 [bacterium]|nr:hypothetical protein [bacterium]
MKKLFIVMALLTFVLLNSASFIEHYGAYVNEFSGKGIALSGSNIFELSSEAIFANPSFFATGKGMKLQMSGSWDRFSEDRSFPAYSFFDNLIGYQVYVSNLNNFYNFSFFISKAMKLGNMNLGIALSTLPIIDYNYSYYEEIRDTANPAPNKYAMNFYDTSSYLRSYNISVGVNPLNNLFFGVTAGLLAGKYDYKKEVKLTEYGESLTPSPDPTYKEELKMDISGMVMTFNFALSFKRFTASFSYKNIGTKGKSYNYTKKDSSNDITITEGNFTLEYPSSIIIGLRYVPRSGIFSNIYLKYTQEMWKNFENDFEPTDFYNTSNLSIGIEHIFDTGAIFRFGVFYKENYEIKSLATAGISIGSGMKLFNKVNIDLGVSYAPLTFETSDIFPDGEYSAFLPGATDRPSLDKVEQVDVKAIMSVGVEF